MMSLSPRLALRAMLLAGFATTATTALAGTTISTSISDSISTAVGSVSTSLKKSSQSVSGDDKVADGDYKVIQMAAAPDQPGMVRLTLQALAQPTPDGTYFLTVPQKAVDAHGVSEGRVLAAHNRPYGVAFAAADTHKAFFLVLEDAWFRELSVKPVVL